MNDETHFVDDHTGQLHMVQVGVHPCVHGRPDIEIKNSV